MLPSGKQYRSRLNDSFFHQAIRLLNCKNLKYAAHCTCYLMFMLLLEKLRSLALALMPCTIVITAYIYYTFHHSSLHYLYYCFNLYILHTHSKAFNNSAQTPTIYIYTGSIVNSLSIVVFLSFFNLLLCIITFAVLSLSLYPKYFIVQMTAYFVQTTNKV